MYNFRTDMADERRDIYKKANNIENEIPGIKTEDWQDGENIKVSKVIVLDKQGEDAIGKPQGSGWSFGSTERHHAEMKRIIAQDAW